MKSFIRILTLCSFFAFGMEVTAQNTEKVVLKNGSVLEGYLAEQRPGKNFAVQSTEAVIFANEDSLRNVSHQVCNISDLSSAWQGWIEDNHVSDGQTITLSTLEFKNSTISNVFIQERGITVKYVDLNERRYVFPWNQLAMTSKKLRDKNQRSGIVDELVMTDGRHFEGQVTDQTPGKGIKIILSDGMVQSFNYSDIAQIISKPYNDKLTLWQQCQLLDEVILKDGETVQGLITSRNIGKDYTFLLHSGQNRIVNAKDVAIFRKLKNDEYKSTPERELADGEIVINGDAKNAYFFNLETTDVCVILEENAASMQMECGDTLVVEANVGNPLASITIAKAQVKEVMALNAKGKKVKQTKPVVTLMDLLQSKNIGTREVTVSGYVKFTLPITESGDYVMQIQGKEGYIVIYVPQNNNN